MTKLKTHDIVCFTPPKSNEEFVGFIETYTEKKIAILFARGEDLRHFSTKRGMPPETLIQGLKVRLRKDEPIPATLQEHIDLLTAPVVKVKKGDVVAYRHDGKEHTGRVLKGGANPEVTLGLNLVVRLDPRGLKIVDIPETHPKLKGFAVASMTVAPGPHLDNEPFRAKITFENRHVIDAVNSGVGGPDEFQNSKTGSNNYVDMLERAVDDALLEAGVKDPFEPMDSWLHWDWFVRPTGIGFIEYVKKN